MYKGIVHEVLFLFYGSILLDFKSIEPVKAFRNQQGSVVAFVKDQYSFTHPEFLSKKLIITKVKFFLKF